MQANASHISFKKWLRKPYIWVLFAMTFWAVTADFWANGLPLYAKKEGQSRYPAIEKKLIDWGLTTGKADLNIPDTWKEKNITHQVWAPIRYSPNQTDRYNDRFQKPHWLRDGAPENFPHFLGTDELGHDVASVLIHGTAISFFIGVLSMLLATIIGIIIGALAGFWGDDRLKSTWIQIGWMLFGITLMWFYGIQTQQASYSKALEEGGISFLTSLFISVAILGSIYFFFVFVSAKIPVFRRGKKMSIPIDFVLSRFIEFMVVLPKIILILAIAALVKPSILLPALIIGFTAWPSISRFTRAEMLHVRHTDYMRSAETFGISQARLFFRHALPNSLSPVPSLVAFGIAGAVLAESTLSFLGIGIPPETFTWGKLLAQGRSNPSAWWVTLLPGILIFLTVTCFHKLGEDLQGNAKKGKSFLRYFL